jgi:hypothetical protein
VWVTIIGDACFREPNVGQLCSPAQQTTFTVDPTETDCLAEGLAPKARTSCFAGPSGALSGQIGRKEALEIARAQQHKREPA